MGISWIVLIVGVVLICVGSSQMSRAKSAREAAQRMLADAYQDGFRVGTRAGVVPRAAEQPRNGTVASAQGPGPVILRPLPAPHAAGPAGPVPPSRPAERAPQQTAPMGAVPLRTPQQPSDRPVFTQPARPQLQAARPIPGSYAPGVMPPGMIQPVMEQQALAQPGNQAGAALQVRRSPVDRRAVLVNAVLGAATFLLVVAAGLWIGTRLNPIAQGAALVALASAFYAAGLALHRKQPTLRPVALAFTITGLALLPIVGVAWWTQFPEQGPAAWVAVSAMGTAAYVYAAVRLDSRIVAALGVVFAASGAFTFGAAMRSGIAWYAASSTLLAVLLSLMATRWAPRLPRVLSQTFVVAHRLLVPSYLIVALCVFPWLRAADALIIMASALVYYLVQRLTAPLQDRALTRWGARAAWLGVVLSLGSALELGWPVTMRCAALALVLIAAQSVGALRRDGVTMVKAEPVAWTARAESRWTPSTLLFAAVGFALLGTIRWNAWVGNGADSILDTQLNWSWYLVLAAVAVFMFVPAMAATLGMWARLSLLVTVACGALLEPLSTHPWSGALLLIAVAMVAGLQWARARAAAWKTGFGAMALATGVSAGGPLMADLAVALGAAPSLRDEAMGLSWAVLALGLGAWRALRAGARPHGQRTEYRWGAGILLAIAVAAGSSVAGTWLSLVARRRRAVPAESGFDLFGQGAGPLMICGVVLACLALLVAVGSAAQLLRASGAPLAAAAPVWPQQQSASPSAQRAETTPRVNHPLLGTLILAGPALLLAIIFGGAAERVIVVGLAYILGAALCAIGSQAWGRSWSACGATAMLLLGQWHVVSMTGAPAVVVLPATAAIVLAGTVVATSRPSAGWMAAVTAGTAGLLLIGLWLEALRTRTSIGENAVQPVAFVLLLVLAVAAILWHARVAAQLGRYRAGTAVALLAVGITALRAVDGQWGWWWGDQVLTAYPTTILVCAWAAPVLVLLCGATAPLWSRHSSGPGDAVAWSAAAAGLPALLLGTTLLVHQSGGPLLLVGALLGAVALIALRMGRRLQVHPARHLVQAVTRMMPVPALGALICGAVISVVGETPTWLGWLAAAVIALSVAPSLLGSRGTAPETDRRSTGADVLGALTPALSVLILGPAVLLGPGSTVLAVVTALAYLVLAATRVAWWLGLLAFAATAWAAAEAAFDLSTGAQEPRTWFLIHAVLLALAPPLLCRRLAQRGRLSAEESRVHRAAGWAAAALLSLGAMAALSVGHTPVWMAWVLVADVVLAAVMAWLQLRKSAVPMAHLTLDLGLTLAALAVVRAIAVEESLRVAPFWFVTVLATLMLASAWWRRSGVDARQLRLWTAAGFALLALVLVVQGTQGTSEEWARHAVLVALFALLLVSGAAFDDAASTWIGLGGLCVDVLVAARHQTIAMLFLLAVMLFGIAIWLLLRRGKQAQQQGSTGHAGPPPHPQTAAVPQQGLPPQPPILAQPQFPGQEPNPVRWPHPGQQPPSVQYPAPRQPPLPPPPSGPSSGSRG